MSRSLLPIGYCFKRELGFREFGDVSKLISFGTPCLRDASRPFYAPVATPAPLVAVPRGEPARATR